jgi:HlyD family secretion protein
MTGGRALPEPHPRRWPGKPTPTIVILFAALLVASGLAWWFTHPHKAATELVLYGNIDLRQVDLAFNDSERVEAVLVSEGDHVHRGQVLARLDTGRLAPRVAQAQGEADAQAQVAQKFRRGSRPEDIAQAQANVDAAQAEAAAAHDKLARLQALAQSSAGRALSRQDVDDARAAADSAAAKVEANRQALRLQQIGPRREDVAQAQAQLQSSRAALALLQRELVDAQLVAPTDAVVRSRLIEPLLILSAPSASLWSPWPIGPGGLAAERSASFSLPPPAQVSRRWRSSGR